MQQTETQPEGLHRPERSELRCLQVVYHPDAELIGARRVLPPEGEWVLGRDDETLLPGAFEDGRVSRRHARLRVSAGAVSVEDLASRNGVYVEGVRIASGQPTPLSAGSVFSLGRVVCRLSLMPARYDKPRHPEILGISPVVAKLLRAIRKVGRRDTPVMLVGEMGVGKELVARALHARSGRRGELVALNCAATSKDLIAAELFGHGRGAFTGAVGVRQGLLARGQGGTIFLDELADAPLPFQPLLLRFLETGRFRPLGSDDEVSSDARIVGGAQPRIADQVAADRFRKDLWSRLARVILEIPPLRERREDIPLLARHFADRLGGAHLELSPEVLVALMRRAWPGNVRELASVIERGVIAFEDSDARAFALGPWLDPDPALSAAPSTDLPEPPRAMRKAPTARPGRDTIEAALDRHQGRVASAAEALGVDRRTLYRWCKQLDIDPSAWR